MTIPATPVASQTHRRVQRPSHSRSSGNRSRQRLSRPRRRSTVVGPASRGAAFPREGPDAHEGTGPRLPPVLDIKSRLAYNLSTLGLLLDEMGQSAAALRSQQEALAIWDTRLAMPATIRASRRSGQTPSTGSPREHKLGRTAEAIRSHEQARDVIRQLVRDHPEVLRYRQALCIGDKGLAGLYRKVGRWEEAPLCWTRPRRSWNRSRRPGPHTITTWPAAWHSASRPPPRAETRSRPRTVDVWRSGDGRVETSGRRGDQASRRLPDRPQPGPTPRARRLPGILMDLAFPPDPFSP